PGPLRHFHRLAAAQNLHQLHDLDVEVGGRGVGYGPHRVYRRLPAFDVTAVIGTPHIDHAGEAAIDLVLVVGDVGGEIGITAVRFHQWPVDVVAEGGGAEQRLLAILPVLHRRALGWRQASLVHVAGAPQRGDGLAHLIARTFDERTLGEKDVV